MINCPALRDQIKKYFSKKIEETQKEFFKLTEIIEQEVSKEQRDVIISFEADVQLDKIVLNLQKLKTALSNPNFGVCRCGSSIEVARLNADPAAILCAKCAPPKQDAAILPFKRKEKENANTSNT